MRIFVTGAAGWTAFSIIQALSRTGHGVVGFDLPTARYPDSAAPLLVEMVPGDIADFDKVESALQACAPDAIIHLAIAVGEGDYANPTIPFEVNVRGTYNLFEAARRHDVQKIVLISSAPVHLPAGNASASDEFRSETSSTKHYPRTGWRSSPGEDHLYDLTKRLQEEIAQDFSETFGMQVLVLRAGHIVDGVKKVDPQGRDLAQVPYCRDGWVCRFDLAQACLRAVEGRFQGCTVFDIIGAHAARRRFDIARSELELGFRFDQGFEEYD